MRDAGAVSLTQIQASLTSTDDAEPSTAPSAAENGEGDEDEDEVMEEVTV
jgi:hypothetical protein